MQFALHVSSVCAYVETVACAHQALMWPGEDTCLRLICDAMELKTQKQTSDGWTLRLRPDAGKRSTSLRALDERFGHKRDKQKVAKCYARTLSCL